MPVDHGQHWSAWLLEWATYSHDAFVAQPALLGQFLNSSLGVDRMVTHVDAVIGVLSRQGFSPAEAVDAYEIVSDCALGCAVGEIRAGPGRPRRPAVAAEYLRVLATRPDDELPNLRALVARQGSGTRPTSPSGCYRAGRHRRAPRGEPWETGSRPSSSPAPVSDASIRRARRRCAGWPARRCRGTTR